MDAVKVVFADAAALEKEIQENMKNGGLSFTAEKTYPPQSVLKVQLCVGERQVFELEAAVIFSSEGFHGAEVRNFSPALLQQLQQALQPFKPSAAPAAAPPAPPPVAATPAPAMGSAPPPPLPGGAPPAGATSSTDLAAMAAFAALAAEKGAAGKIAQGKTMPPFADVETVARALEAKQPLAIPFHHLFLTLCRKEMSGVLRLRYTGRNKEFVFFHGLPVSCRLEPKMGEESLTSVLLMNRLINRQQFLAAQEDKRKTRRDLPTILVEQKAITEAQLKHAQELQSVVIFQDLFEIAAADFFWTAGQLPATPKQPMQVKPLAVAYQGLVKAFTPWHQTDIDPLLAPYKSKYPLRAGKVPPGDLLMDDKDAKFLETVITGRRNFRDTVESSPYGRPETLRRLLALAMIGVVEFHDNPEGLQEDRDNDLLALVEDLDSVNHFDLLHLHWGSPGYFYERALKKELARLGPSGEFAKSPEKVKQAAAALRKKVEEAGRVLCDESQRVAYRLTLMDEQKCRFTADIKIKKGELALFKGDVQEAYDCFVAAVELNPKSAEARSGLAEAKKRGGKPKVEE